MDKDGEIVPHGKGIQIHKYGFNKEGWWKQSKENGHMRVIDTEGGFSEFECKDDRTHGLRVLTYANGTKEYSLWENNRKIKDLSEDEYKAEKAKRR